MTVLVPDGVRRKALAGGEEGRRWLSSVDDLVAALSAEWGLRVDSIYERGSTSIVASVTSGDGTPAVLKLVMPAERPGLAQEVVVLRAAGGRSCVRLLRSDLARGAVLLERLGRQLFQLGLPRDVEYSIIFETVRDLWSVPCDGCPLPSGADKARWLIDYIVGAWGTLGQPCSSRVIDVAAEYAARRIEAFDPATAVLVHGDAHAWNTLEDPAGAGTFRLVDPDGVIAEPEYDMAISMREFPDELLAGDAVALGRRRLASLARLSGLDEAGIWEWALLEVLASGLLHLQLGNLDPGRSFLAVAHAWAGGS